MSSPINSTMMDDEMNVLQAAPQAVVPPVASNIVVINDEEDKDDGDTDEMKIDGVAAKGKDDDDDNDKNHGKAGHTNGNDDDDDDDDPVQILTAQQVEKELRRKRRRKLYQMLKQPGAIPSFLKVVTQSEWDGEPEQAREKTVKDVDDHDNDDEEDFLLAPPVVVIDVDYYLGLKTKRNVMVPTPEIPVSSRTATAAPVPSTPSSTVLTTRRAVMSPGEEGWYEGSTPLALPEDKEYLGELQQLIRSNLELFTATDIDVQMSQAGRRIPTVRGKVGIRCIHCARAAAEALAEPNAPADPVSIRGLWPPGAVSYPVTISGLTSACSQKPQLHFEHCPNLPLRTRARFWNILQKSRSNQTHDPTVDASPPSVRKRKRSGEINVQLYYLISCARLGIVEYKDGLRFGRDIKLDPLPFSVCRAQVEREHPEFAPKGQRQSLDAVSSRHLVTSSSVTLSLTPPARVASSSHATYAGTASSPPPAARNGAMPDEAMSAKLTVDDESKKVLADAIAEPDDPTRLIGRASDKALVTDYMFLTVRQMAICHAGPQDFSTRGKKTKLMRHGFAGFCCRYCAQAGGGGVGGTMLGGMDYSCRSFSSVPDNLASAISNSFIIHLQKCLRTPAPIKHALSAYKRLHTRQMQLLPYGSQRKLFHLLWDRLREADIPQDQVETLIVEREVAPARPPPPASRTVMEAKPDAISSATTTAAAANHGDPTLPDVAPPVATVMDATRENARNAAFPVCSDAQTQAILQKFEEDWDQAENDNLITKDQRWLVSDYVFLCMRQLKIAVPTAADFMGNRRNNIVQRLAGFQCRHCCDEQPPVVPSGRSFPSAPDNMASALNSSLYNHMQHCPKLPFELKQALIQLRKIHSAQCQSLTFGSQRRFFNQVYSMLKEIPIDASLLNPPPSTTPAKADATPRHKNRRSHSKSAATTATLTSSWTMVSEVLSKYHFAQGSSYIQCLKCRMVPFELRAPGSLLFHVPDRWTAEQVLQQHSEDCAGDGIHLGLAGHALGQIVLQYGSQSIQGLAFTNLVAQVVAGQNSLIRVFTHDILQDPTFLDVVSTSKTGAGATGPSDFPPAMTAATMKTNSDPISGESQNPRSTTTTNTCQLWRQLPSDIDFDKVQAAFEGLADKLGLTETNDNRLEDHVRFIRFLQIISPSFQCPRSMKKFDENTKEEESKNEGVKEDEDEEEEAPTLEDRMDLDERLGPDSVAVADSPAVADISAVANSSAAADSSAVANSSAVADSSAQDNLRKGLLQQMGYEGSF